MSHLRKWLRNRFDHATMASVDHDLNELRELGERRAAALAELEEVRKAVLAKLPALRKPGREVTWREIAAAAHYTETRLQRMWAERED